MSLLKSVVARGETEAVVAYFDETYVDTHHRRD